MAFEEGAESPLLPYRRDDVRHDDTHGERDAAAALSVCAFWRTGVWHTPKAEPSARAALGDGARFSSEGAAADDGAWRRVRGTVVMVRRVRGSASFELMAPEVLSERDGKPVWLVIETHMWLFGDRCRGSRAGGGEDGTEVFFGDEIEFLALPCVRERRLSDGSIRNSLDIGRWLLLSAGQAYGCAVPGAGGELARAFTALPGGGVSRPGTGTLRRWERDVRRLTESCFPAGAGEEDGGI